MPYIRVKDYVVCEASYSFSDLTGYNKEELVNNTIDSVFEKLFKTSVDFSRFYDGMEREIYLFTRSCHARFVNMTSFTGYYPEEMIILFLEAPNSRVEDKLVFIEQISKGDDIGIAILNIPDMILLETNKNFLDLFKHPYNVIKESIGVPLDKIACNWVDKDGEFIWKETISSGKAKKIEEFEIKRDGEKQTFLDVVFAPIKESGVLKYIMCKTSDVTERVLFRNHIETRSMIIQQQRDEIEKILNIKNEFFNFISHEFKVPLTVINAAVQTIESIYKDTIPEKVKRLIYQIKQSSFRQLRLVNNLLDIAKAEGGYMKVHKRNRDIVSVTRSIIDSVRLYANQKNIEITFKSSFKQKIVGIDEEKYERIILNLLSNAIKFTPPGKKAGVEIYYVDDFLCIMVKDEGEGIAEDKLELIFNRFVQVDSSLIRERLGTGLGLALVKLLVNAMDGEISVKSKVGYGSTFTIMLPMEKVAASEDCDEQMASQIIDSGLQNSAAIEFSDIYLDNFQNDTCYDSNSSYNSEIEKGRGDFLHEGYDK